MFVKQDYAINADYNIGDLSTNHSFLLNGKPIEGKTYVGDETTIHVDDDTNVISVKDGGITSDKLADGAVTADKIADGAAVANILDGSITRNKLSTDLNTWFIPSFPYASLRANYPIATLRFIDTLYNNSTGFATGKANFLYILYSDFRVEFFADCYFTSNVDIDVKLNLAKTVDDIENIVGGSASQHAELYSDMTKFLVIHNTSADGSYLPLFPNIHVATDMMCAVYVNGNSVRNRNSFQTTQPYSYYITSNSGEQSYLKAITFDCPGTFVKNYNMYVRMSGYMSNYAKYTAPLS